MFPSLVLISNLFYITSGKTRLTNDAVPLISQKIHMTSPIKSLWFAYNFPNFSYGFPVFPSFFHVFPYGFPQNGAPAVLSRLAPVPPWVTSRDLDLGTEG